MGANYLPSQENALDAWLNNFKTLIAASPTTYGLVAGDATALTAAFTSWHAAFLAATNPPTRTKSTVETKNIQKANILGLVRNYAATIRANIAVAPGAKIDLGLHVKDVMPTPVPPPATQPVLTITEPMRGAQALKIRDAVGGDRRAKPAGAAGVLLFRNVGTEAVTDYNQCAFMIFSGKTDLMAEFAPADNGKVATYFARWTNSKGEMGPWSPGVSMQIAA